MNVIHCKHNNTRGNSVVLPPVNCIRTLIPSAMFFSLLWVRANNAAGENNPAVDNVDAAPTMCVGMLMYLGWAVGWVGSRGRGSPSYLYHTRRSFSAQRKSMQ